MKETLEQLKKENIKLGIISSNNEINIKKFLLNNDIDDFSFIHCEMNIFGKAPVISHALKKYSLHKENTLYVGDEVRDIEACKKAGLDIAAVTWGFNSKNILKKHKPTFSIESPLQLLDFI
jgi:HAD superfamily hydrolase (TIGR01549 family)